jgi:protein SCO1/2
MRVRHTIAAVLLAVLVPGLLTGCGGGSHAATLQGQPTTFDGAPLPSGVRAPGFMLSGPLGERVSLAGLRGSVVAIAFLDSRCAPGCVLMAQQIRGAIDELARPPQVLLVTTAPRADTPTSVAAFLREVSLTGRVHYLTGPASALARVWHAYRVTLPSAGSRRFEAALSVLLIDRAGNERVLFGIEQITPEGLAHDIRVLQSGGGA